MKFHFVITLAIPGGMANFDAVYATKPGETRLDAYRNISRWAKEEAACDGAVVFFSLEPNELPGGAR